MTDLVVVVNKNTGAKELKQLGYYLPDYDIGMVVCYLDKHGIEQDGVVTGIDMNVANVDNEIVTNCLYEIDNSFSITDDEITGYYPETQEDLSVDEV